MTKLTEEDEALVDILSFDVSFLTQSEVEENLLEICAECGWKLTACDDKRSVVFGWCITAYKNAAKKIAASYLVEYKYSEKGRAWNRLICHATDTTVENLVKGNKMVARDVRSLLQSIYVEMNKNYSVV